MEENANGKPKYPDYIYDELCRNVRMGKGFITRSDVDEMRREEVFQWYCSINGLDGWHESIIDWVYEIFGVDLYKFEDD